MFQIKTNLLIAANYRFKHIFRVIKTVSVLSNDEYESLREVLAKQMIANNEDVSSFVRFNRDMIALQPNQFSDLLDANNNVSIKLKIELICAEYEYIKQTLGLVPNGITSDHMKQLLSSSAYVRQQLFQKWYLNGSRSLRKSLCKTIPKLVSQDYDYQLNCNNEKQFEIFDQNGNLNYGLNGNTIIGRIGIRRTKRRMRQRYRVSTQLGQHLVIDLNSDYEAFVTEKCHRFGLTQIIRLYGNNLKRYSHPYNLHLCNINTSSVTYQNLTKLYGKPAIDLMANVTNKSYLDIENKQNIIFVTSHANDELIDYDHSAIFIMNPFIEILSLNDSDSQRIKRFLDHKFASEGIRSARIPLEHYLQFKHSFSILIHNCVNILNDVKMGCDWKTAILNHSSTKLLMTESDIMHERAMKILERQSYLS